MSAIVLLPIVIPAAAAAWPAVLTAATAAAAALGYAATRGKSNIQAQTKDAGEVTLEVDHCEEVTGNLALGEALTFTKGDVQLSFFRDTNGKMAIKVSGKGKGDAELKAIGQQFSKAVVQQYAYHRLMTELKQRNFNVVGEQVEEDGTVRIQVRTYQG
jgi:hypothetical protein